MNNAQIASHIRTVLKFASGMLIAHGMTNTAGFLNAPDISGAIILFLTALVSHFIHSAPDAPTPPTPPCRPGLTVLLALMLPALVITSARSQTNQVTNLLPTNGPAFTVAGLFSGGLGAGLQRGGQDLVSFIENTSTTNGILTAEAGALYAESTKKVGGFLDAYLPVGGTNSAFGAGFGLAYLDGNFYDATLNARLGDTFTLPFIKVPLYAYVESGGGYNLSKMEIISQAFTGALFKIPITTSQTLTLGGAVGTISDYAGNIYALGASYTFTW